MPTNKKILIPLFIFIIIFVLLGLFSIIQFLDSKFGFIKTIKLYLASATVQRGDIKAQLAFPGIIDFEQHATLQFQQIPTVGIQIAWIGPKVGDQVKLGQSIAKLDSTEPQKTLTAAQAAYRSAKASLDLILDNIHLSQYGMGGFSNIGSANETQTQKTQRQQAEEVVNQAYDSLQKAQRELQLTALIAPFDGILAHEDISTSGVNFTDPSIAQFEIINPKTFFFNVDMEETEIANIHEGDKGVILLNSYPSRYMVSTVQQISFTSHKDSNNNDVFGVKITLDGIDNNDYKFRSGMSGLFMINSLAENSLHIPLEFLHQDDNGSYVNVGRDRQKNYVLTGVDDGKNIEIVKGLNEGDQIYY